MTATATRPTSAASRPTPVFDGSIRSASSDIKGEGHNRKRALDSVSAIGTTPAAAVNALVEKLDCEPQAREMFGGDHYDY